MDFVVSVLKFGGVFLFVEVLDLEGWFLRLFYMFYLKLILLFVEWLFMCGV